MSHKTVKKGSPKKEGKKKGDDRNRKSVRPPSIESDDESDSKDSPVTDKKPKAPSKPPEKKRKLASDSPFDSKGSPVVEKKLKAPSKSPPPKTSKEIKSSESEDSEKSETPEIKPPRYVKAAFTATVQYKPRKNWSSAAPNRIQQVNIPGTRPEGTSGEKEGGHLTPWVAIQSEIYQAIREDMDIDAAIKAVKELIENYQLMPGHARAEFLNTKLKEVYKETKKKLDELVSIEDVLETYKERYLDELIQAYLSARNALPLTAVATTDNKGHGESKINELLWQYESNGKGKTPKQLAGLLWCMLDVDAASKWADKEKGYNWQALSPPSSPKEDEDLQNDEDPTTWEPFDRRMIEVLAQHVMGMRKSYLKSYKDSEMAEESGIKQLFAWMNDPKQLKESCGVQKVTGEYWEDLQPKNWTIETIQARLATVIKKAENGEYKSEDIDNMDEDKKKEASDEENLDSDE